jgi:hypothetical protein
LNGIDDYTEVDYHAMAEADGMIHADGLFSSGWVVIKSFRKTGHL